MFHPASATIVGTEVEVSSPSVSKPVAVRYAYKGFPYANLYNQRVYPLAPSELIILPSPSTKPTQTPLPNAWCCSSLASLKLGIEDKVKLVAICNRHVSQELEAKLKTSLLQVNKVGKAKVEKRSLPASAAKLQESPQKTHAAIEKRPKLPS